MTRKIRRLERRLDDLESESPSGDRPPELSPAEKDVLADLFDVDPWGDGPSPAQELLARLHREEAEK